MHIQLDGVHNQQMALADIAAILEMLQTRYGIALFKNLHIELSMIDQHGEEVELVDDQTDTPLRHIRIRDGFKESPPRNHPNIQLVVDNSKSAK